MTTLSVHNWRESNRLQRKMRLPGVLRGLLDAVSGVQAAWRSDTPPTMPRASQYLLEGHTYHLTHRCHDRQFVERVQGSYTSRWTFDVSAMESGSTGTWAVRECRSPYGSV